MTLLTNFLTNFTDDSFYVVDTAAELLKMLKKLNN